MLLIAPMSAGITHSRCTCWHDPGEILLIILWMSYFLYPQLARLPEARENRFSTEERAKFQKLSEKGFCWPRVIEYAS